MVDNNAHLTSVSPDDLADLDQLLGELKGKAQQSHDSGNAFMHTVYVRLIAIVSPVVVGTHARMEREALAEQRRLLKMAKEAQRSPTSSIGKN